MGLVSRVSLIIISCYSRNYIGKASSEPLSSHYYLNSLGAYVALESQTGALKSLGILLDKTVIGAGGFFPRPCVREVSL